MMAESPRTTERRMDCWRMGGGAHFARAGEKFDHSDAMKNGGQAGSMSCPFRRVRVSGKGDWRGWIKRKMHLVLATN